jgi:soluble lytic murein transglycosylase-like protein
MDGNTPYSIRYGKLFYTIFVCCILLFISGSWQRPALQNGYQSPASDAGGSADAVSKPDEQDPVQEYADTDTLLNTRILTDSDQELYHKIFYAQKAADWDMADKYISRLSNKVLLGNVLAERYLHPHYNTSLKEITSWLKNYAGQAQAYSLIELANNKYPEFSGELPKMEKPQTLKGYGDDNSEDIKFDNNPQAKKLWSYGIEAWRSGKKQEAARLFSSIANKKDELSDWQYSAANFWAYRAYSASGEKNKANGYLEKAARNPRVFYGILARKQLGKPLELDTGAIKLENSTISNFLIKPEVERIIALAESGLNERAEKEARSLFPTLSKQEKWSFLLLANHLNLASVQISVAKQLESGSRPLDALKYPIPKWKPADGFTIEPALLYALMRQESGFHQSAISSGGALGLMQLMPQTARKMQRSYMSANGILENINLSEPVLNVTLGERYVKHLLDNSLVNGNLFYMLAAYNAGAGRLKEWQDNINYNDDPLLFVESIPYQESRSYVMQVMTNYWIYSELAGISNNSILALLQNNWPDYSDLKLPGAKPIANNLPRNHNG